VGDPWEKLLGFLIAVVILAFYIGIVNLLLMFASFSLFQGNTIAYFVSFIGVIPLWFYATYRARRYVLARTRWRGVRFGVDAGAWAYTAHAIGHWMLTILSLGILWPRMTFHLEKFRTDRTWYGSAQLEQGGDWQMLMPALRPFVAAGIVAGGGAAAFFTDHIGMAAALWSAAALWACYALAQYPVETFRLLTNTKTADGVGLLAQPRVGRVIWIYVTGYALVTFFVLIPGMFLIFALALIQSAELARQFDLVDVRALSAGLPRWLLLGAGALIYFALFLLWSTFRHVFITLPLWKHYAETLQVLGAPRLAQISQRSRDEFREAEGFAEALDLGASI